MRDTNCSGEGIYGNAMRHQPRATSEGGGEVAILQVFEAKDTAGAEAWGHGRACQELGTKHSSGRERVK